MVYKRVVIPDCGMIFEISKGISTGHPFTSIMNTLCAYLTLSTSIEKACSRKEIQQTWITNAGDDTVCKLPLNKLDAINQIMQRDSGMRMSDLSEKAGVLTSNILDHKISFLKYV
jgi:DNA-directed RNA polymerase